MTDAAGPIAFQGLHGAYADLTARAIFPGLATLPCPTFEAVFVAVREGKADRGVIPVENSLYGRIADIHHLLPGGGLKIVGECYQPIHHCLLGVPGAKLEQVREALSQEPALGQVAKTLRRLGIKPVARTDTAGSAAEVAATGDPSKAAVASALAAEIHGLDILLRNIEDAEHNTTRFLVMARESVPLPADCPVAVVGIAFEVRNIPAALYKVLGGFATNGINMTKLESYMVGGSFSATQFYADVQGHPKDRAVELALEELEFVSRPKTLRILGVYPAHRFRETLK